MDWMDDLSADIQMSESEISAQNAEYHRAMQEQDYAVLNWRGPKEFRAGSTISNAFFRAVQAARRGEPKSTVEKHLGAAQRMYDREKSMSFGLNDSVAINAVASEFRRIQGEAIATIEDIGRMDPEARIAMKEGAVAHEAQIREGVVKRNTDPEYIASQRLENEIAEKVAGGSTFHKTLYAMSAVPVVGQNVAHSLHQSEKDGILAFGFLPESLRNAAKLAMIGAGLYATYRVGRWAYDRYR